MKAKEGTRVSLLQCPFCGEKGTMRRVDADPPYIDEEYWVAECSHDSKAHRQRGTGCPAIAMAIADTRDSAARAWNSRYGMAAALAARPAYATVEAWEAMAERTASEDFRVGWAMARATDGALKALAAGKAVPA
jgi:hypothetical protein